MAVSILDYSTGPFLSFSIFYLVPIATIAWFSPGAEGLLMCLLCASVWLAGDILTYYACPHPPYAWWNGLVRLGLFVTVGYSLSALRNALQHERDLARTDPL